MTAAHAPPNGLTQGPSSPAGAAVPIPRYALAELPVRRFTVDEYHRMIASGYFAADERFELLSGWIVAKMSRDPIHDAAIEIAEDVLRSRVLPGWRVRVQCAITTDDSEPEPDLVVVRGRPQDHLERHPGPAELALLVEVANTTLHDDRTFKGPIYASAGIREYWIINLVDSRVEVYTDPSGPDPAPAYRRRQDYSVGQSVPISIGGTAVAAVPVADLIPRSQP
jgi:Uma2 family endonuclease